MMINPWIFVIADALKNEFRDNYLGVFSDPRTSRLDPVYVI